MFGLPALHEAATRHRAPAGAARHLLQELKRPLGGAQVAVVEPDIGVDDARQGQAWKVVALRDELGPDDEVDLSPGHRVELAPDPLGPTRRVGGEHEHSRLGEQRPGLLGDPFDTRPAGHERVDLAAAGTMVGLALDVAAMMAHQRAAKAMLDEPRRTLPAGAPMAAGAAHRQGARSRDG